MLNNVIFVADTDDNKHHLIEDLALGSHEATILDSNSSGGVGHDITPSLEEQRQLVYANVLKSMEGIAGIVNDITEAMAEIAALVHSKLQ